ncbi:hypothetical protein U9M48_044506 [Paspalum notatum var. saurae]|uniref:Uncharacterized protein n=1 Tax=Paspalum notatum var. saurae TaxID=547442 RepID=A0AAQ3UZJ0_PASNO
MAVKAVGIVAAAAAAAAWLRPRRGEAAASPQPGGCLIYNRFGSSEFLRLPIARPIAAKDSIDSRRGPNKQYRKRRIDSSMGSGESAASQALSSAVACVQRLRPALCRCHLPEAPPVLSPGNAPPVASFPGAGPAALPGPPPAATLPWRGSCAALPLLCPGTAHSSVPSRTAQPCLLAPADAHGSRRPRKAALPH